MLKDHEVFSSFSVDNIAKAREFYGGMLGYEVETPPGMEEYGMMELHLKHGYHLMVYEKPDHQPASFTILNFVVPDIDKTIGELEAKGVNMLQYNNDDYPQDEKGVARGLTTGMGPDMAWFNDPAGNVLGVMQTE